MNKDILRKAVELADGFTLIDSDVELNNEWYINLKLPQFVLDALAAQLVRQVDALNNAWVAVSASGVCKVSTNHNLATIRGEGGRTENTITAIVESGVLE